MKYSALVKRRKQFKYSSNVCFDLYNPSKLSDFIPNQTTTEILREYLSGIINGSSSIHSRILYGSYGTGKSHLLTVIGELLSRSVVSGKDLNQFLGVLKKYDDDLAHDIKRFFSDPKRFLVVPVYTDQGEFGKCISYSLKKQLEHENIDVAFSGLFEEAISILDKWKSGKDSKQRLDEECAKIGTTSIRLRRALETRSASAEADFRKVYKGVTYGAEFNATLGDFIENLKNTNKALADNFRGVVFIFDEFGRYLEDNESIIKVKEIQDLAEYCDHSDFENHLILVSHKQLSMYTENMKESVSKEWKRIEGRFKPTSINIKYDQCLSLVGSIIPKTDKWDSFKEKYSNNLNNLYNQAWDFKGFLGINEDKNNTPFEDGFPLHPITLYSLDRLSKKVAQNERTFFTYLAGDEDYSLFSVLNNMSTSSFHFVGLDSIYDYFEFNIKSYKTDDAYSVYKRLQYAISKLASEQDSIYVRVLKAMAVIFIIDDSNIISNNRLTLTSVIDGSPEQISQAIDELENRKIIKYMRQYGYYDYFDSSIFDLESMFQDKLSGISDEMVINVLNESFSNFVLYPYSYNAHYHMNRVFFPVFAKKEMLTKKSLLYSIPSYYDGLCIFVLDGDASIRVYTKMEGIPDRSILLVNDESERIENEVKKYIAIKYYYSKRNELAKDDPTVVKELELYLNEQRAIIEQLILEWRSLRLSTVVISDHKRQKISSEQELSDLASQIMNVAFSKTIIVNNDLLNKNVLSGAIKLARKKALVSIICEKDIYENCAPLTPECNVIRSVLSKNGISSDSLVEENEINRLDDGQYSGKYVMDEIARFLKKAEKGQVSINIIYNALKREPFGLRDGYIPVLLAYALRDYQNVSLYFHGTEHDYNEDELVKALSESENYSLYISNWNATENSYIEGLEKLFSGYLIDSHTSNRLKRLYEAMNSHYASVSKSARSTELYVSDKTKKYRQLLNCTHSDYNKFFFESLLEIDANMSDLNLHIKNIKQELEDVPQRQFFKLEQLIRRIMNVPSQQSISAAFIKKYQEEWADKSSIVFDYTTNAFLEFAKDITPELKEEELIKNLAKLITGFEIEYWSDNKISDFEETINDVLSKLSQNIDTDSLSDGNVRISIEVGGEDTIISKFSDNELSSAGKMMLNKLKKSVSNFGESVSYEEKINIITKLLKDMIV